MSPFANPVYRRLFTAQMVSLAGTGVTTIALALLAWDLAGKGAGQVLGMALALKMVVYVGLAPVMGAFAHRLPRRAWLVSLDLARVAIVLCLPFVTRTWQIYALILLLNACAAGFTPVFQASIPDVIGDEAQYQKALSYAQVAYSLEQVLSPALAGILLLVMHYHGLFVLDACSFVVSALLIVSTALPVQAPADRSKRLLDNLAFGTVAYLRTPRLRAVWAMYFAVAAASAMVIVNTVVYVRDYLGRSNNDVAWAVAASGAGSMLAAFAVPALLNRWNARALMLAGSFLLAMCLLAGRLVVAYPVLLVLWALIGVGLAVVQTPVGSLVRRSCREGDSTAFFAANFSLSHFCWLIAYPLAGFASASLGIRGAFLVMGALAAAAAVVALAIYPAPDPAEIEHTHPALTHDHASVHDGDHFPEAYEDATVHRHRAVTHTHRYVIDRHHPHWVKRCHGSSSG